MQAWRFHTTGDITHLKFETTDMPQASQDDALVEIHCASLNPADRFLVQGQYPRAGAPPFTPGRDGSGIIVKAARHDRFKEGDRVCIIGGLTGISTPGTFAEYSAVPEYWLAPLPEEWSFEEGAAAPLVHLTAWRALHICGGIKPDDTVLITGASGGVGTAALFLAKCAGARVVVLSRSPQKRAALEKLGADIALDSSSDTLEKDIKHAAGSNPISLVVENLGGHYLEKSIRVISPGGRIIIIGLLAALTCEITLGLLIHKNIRLEGMSVSAFSASEAQACWKSILECFECSGKKPLISRVYPMEELQAAFAHLQEGPLGKVLLRTR